MIAEPAEIRSASCATLRKRFDQSSPRRNLAASINLEALVLDVELSTIAVVLDLVQPAVTSWHALDRFREERPDEARKWGFHTDKLSALTLQRQRLNSTPTGRVAAPAQDLF